MNKCIICNRNIRTGWLYCYEHRNSAHSEHITSNKLSPYQNTQFVIEKVGF